MVRRSLRAFFIILFLSCLKSSAQSFPISLTPYVATNPTAVVAVDVNGDGKKDLVVAAGLTNLLIILTNNGAGFFTSNTAVIAGAAGIYPNSLTAADVNGDGKMDLLCPMYSRNAFNYSRLAVLTNNGAGGFASAALLITGTNPICATAADINGDGWPDLITANAGNFSQTSLSIFTNNRNGGFGSNATINVGSQFDSGLQWVTAADLNGDGFPDLVCACFYDSTLTVLTNNGLGRFTVASVISVPGSPTMVGVADVNGSGRPALICADTGNTTLSILTNAGGGHFAIASSPNCVPSGFAGTLLISAGDLNGDGVIDLACFNETDQSVSVLTNDTTGHFTLATRLPIGTPTFFGALADLNGDGRLDIVTDNELTNTITILTNAGTYLPRVFVKKAAGQAIVKWPSQWSGWAGWSLQQSPDLNGNHWASYSGVTNDDGINITATNSALSGNQFFRLVHP